MQLHRGSATTYKIKQSMDFKYVFIIKKLSSVCVCVSVCVAKLDKKEKKSSSHMMNRCWFESGSIQACLFVQPMKWAQV